MSKIPNALVGVRDDTAPATAVEGEEAAIRITEFRSAHVNLRNSAGTETGTATVPVRIDPTGTTTQPVSGPLTDTQLRAEDVKTRDRVEDKAHLAHAQGTATVAAGAWAILASITIATGKKYRLLMAEGDFDDLAAIANARGIRIRQATTVRATALTGANQPNPDIEGLTLENTSGSNESWDIQGRNGDAALAHDMYGWFTWVEVSD